MNSLEKPLSNLLQKAKSKSPRRIIVAAAEDKAVLLAIHQAMLEGIVHPILVGNKAKIRPIVDEIGFPYSGIDLIGEDDPATAAITAVQLINQGEGDILMKGLVPTAPLLKAVLDKEKGLKRRGTLSHLAIFEMPTYHKLIGLTDAAMNIAPDINEKVDIILNAVEIYHRLGVAIPKVAVLAPIEVVNPKIESTTHAALLTLMQQRKQFKECLIDGPLALDNAISREAADSKDIVSEVAGDADILIAPAIDAGNMLYKAMVFLAGATVAGFVTGAHVPIVLTSRADSDSSKLLSIALAAALD